MKKRKRWRNRRRTRRNKRKRKRSRRERFLKKHSARKIFSPQFSNKVSTIV